MNPERENSPLKRFRHRVSRANPLNPAVIGRVACLGRDVFHRARFSHVRFFNVQKGRIDMFMEWMEGAKRPDANIVLPFVPRQDIKPLIQEQASTEWKRPFRRPRFLLMDSFSELTDQKFTHRSEGWSFLSHYSDIQHTQEFESLFRSEGLLQLESFEDSYNRFFAWFEREFPGVPVYFLHFPTNLDTRAIFHERGEAILRTLRKLESNRKYITNFTVNEQDVEKSNIDDYPYHFGEKTIQKFLQSFLRSGRPG